MLFEFCRDEPPLPADEVEHVLGVFPAGLFPGVLVEVLLPVEQDDRGVE
jgi:hypothetical protein